MPLYSYIYIYIYIYIYTYIHTHTYMCAERVLVVLNVSLRIEKLTFLYQCSIHVETIPLMWRLLHSCTIPVHITWATIPQACPKFKLNMPLEAPNYVIFSDTQYPAYLLLGFRYNELRRIPKVTICVTFPICSELVIRCYVLKHWPCYS